MSDQTKAVIVDVQIPFISMVVLILKFAIAAVPALLIIFVAIAIFGAIIT